MSRNSSFKSKKYEPPEYIAEKEPMPIIPDNNEFGEELITRFLNMKTIPIINKNKHSVNTRLTLGAFKYDPRPKPDGVKV